MQLQLNNVDKSYGAQRVLQAVSLQLEPGCIGALLGASGSGKTTLLRCIAGFEAIAGGQISLGDRVVSDANEMVAPHRRGVGMVFQDHALFGHLSVAANVAFGLHALSPAERNRRVSEVLELVGLASLQTRFPEQLSGGQQQRAALARAMAPRPRLLLLDEPFASLDRDLRERLTADVSAILRQSKTTALWVTHNPEEAMRAADTVGVMDGGQLLQWDLPEVLYQAPSAAAVAELTGDCRWLSVPLPKNGMVDTPLGSIAAVPVGDPAVPADSCRALVRPEHIKLSSVVDGRKPNAQVVARWFQGAQYHYELLLADESELVIASPESSVTVGDEICVGWATDRVRVFVDK